MSLLDSPSPLLLEPTDETGTKPNIKVLVCTANIGNEAPNLESMSEWIPNDGETKSVLQNQPYPVRESRGKKLVSEGPVENTDEEKFDIIAIGMQEATFELSEEDTKSFVEGNSDAEQEENANNHDCHNGLDDTRLLHQMLTKVLPSFTRAVSYQRGQMRLMIFYRKDAISLKLLGVKAQNTGKGGRDNKGGIVAECDVGSGTRISFLTAHLEAHEGLEKYNTRCSTLSDIFGGTTSELANSLCDVSLTSHFTFAMGDLNFRTRLPDYEIGSAEHIAEAQKLAKNQDWDTLNKHDELVRALNNKECLVGFCTPRCDFPPTFKIERKDGYAYKSNRSPSYTDRILYKTNHNLSDRIDLKAYGPIDHFTTSDHKPVRGAYEIQRNPRLRFQSIAAFKDETCFGVIPSLDLWRSIAQLVSNTKANPETRLHVSISSIECTIEESAVSDSSCGDSTIFASVLTTPNDAIERAEDNTSFSWKNLWPTNGIMDPLQTEWRNTERISTTSNPRWEKEIRCAIQSYPRPGASVDLTGAILYILICETKDANSKPLGSCSVNLASLIIDSMGRDDERGKGVEQCKEPNRQSSTRSSNVKVDEMLMSNGKEVGRIKFNIELLRWRSK